MASSASELITSFNSFEPSTVSYSALKPYGPKAKIVKVFDSRKNPLVLSTPLMLTWGINKNVNEDSGKVDYSLSLQFPNEEYANPNTTKFLEKMKALEEKFIDDIVANSKEWLGKKSSSREMVCEAYFTRMLKHRKHKDSNEIDESSAPTLRLKIPFWQEKFNVEFYDTEQQPIFTPDMPLEDDFEKLISKGSHVVALIRCVGLCYAGSKMSVVWQLEQAVVRRPARFQLNGRCMLSITSEDQKKIQEITKTELEEADEPEDDEVVSKPVVSTKVEDTDDEGEQEEEAPAPAPEPVKKKVVKKKVVKKSA